MTAPPDVCEIPVHPGERRYAVWVGRGALARLPPVLASLASPAVLVVSSPRVWGLHGRRLGSLGRRSPILVPDGESSKSRAWLGRLHDAFLARGLDRRGV